MNEIERLIKSMDCKLDLILASLSASRDKPARERKPKAPPKVNKHGAVMDAITTALSDGTPRHVTEIYRIVNELVPIKISEGCLSSAIWNAMREGRIERTGRKGVYKKADA